MNHYKAKNNEVVDQDGKQIAVVLPVCCSNKKACQLAKYAAEMLNKESATKTKLDGEVS